MNLLSILLLVNSGLVTFFLPAPSSFGFLLAEAAVRHGNNLVVAGAPLAGSLEIKRNSTGHIIDLSGVSALMLDWLTQRYKFNYSILQVNDSVLEPEDTTGSQLPGLISYVVNGQCDVIMAAIKVSSDRFRNLDFVHPWMYARSAFLIPMPSESNNNILAVVKPFHCWVWIALIASLISVVLALLCLGRYLSPINSETSPANDNRQVGSMRLKDVVTYAVGMLLNQGGRISNTTLKIRVVTGAWCLVTLVLANVYEGILISYVTSKPRDKPLVESPDDLLNNKNIHMVVEKGQGADIIFRTAESGIFKAFGDKLRSYPKSRCRATQQCIDLVKSTPYQHVYFNTRVVLLSVMREDFRKTGQCNLIEAAERYSDNTAFCWGLTKNSPYTERFNRGILTMREMGLVGIWEKWFEPDVRPCLWNNKKGRRKKKQKKPLVRLTLTNLTGAFVLLAVGYAAAFIVFVKEKIAFRYFRRRIGT